MSKHDLNLLRPLTLDDIKPGTIVTWVVGDKEVDWGEIVYGPTEKRQEFVANWKEDGLTVHSVTSADMKKVRLTPLAWVEDKPVYPGDVLYGKWPDAEKGGYVVGDTLARGRFLTDDKGIALTDNVERLTWTPPKTKHRVWMNLYPDGSCGVYSTEEHANARVVSRQTVRRLIEWES